MTFEEVLDQTVAMLQRRGRVRYRTLKLQFKLDDETLEALEEEILYSQPQVVDDAGKGLIWTGDAAACGPDAQREIDAKGRFHHLVLAVIGQLQHDRRVTYRTLKYILGIDDARLAEIREELTFRRLAVDEEGKGLVWTGETQSAMQPTQNWRGLRPQRSELV